MSSLLILLLLWTDPVQSPPAETKPAAPAPTETPAEAPADEPAEPPADTPVDRSDGAKPPATAPVAAPVKQKQPSWKSGDDLMGYSGDYEMDGFDLDEGRTAGAAEEKPADADTGKEAAKPEEPAAGEGEDVSAQWLKVDRLLAEVTAGDEPTPLEDAAVLHAKALQVESQGDGEGALNYLRDAFALSPKDSEIAFDLARVAVLADERTGVFSDDVEGLLKLAPVSSEARLLRAYLLAERGDTSTARSELAGIGNRLDPTRREVVALNDMLTKQGQSRVFSARVAMSSQLDSNVTLVESGRGPVPSGFRMALNAEGTLTLRRSRPELIVTPYASLGLHLNDRQNLAPYDGGTAGAAIVSSARVAMLGIDASASFTDYLSGDHGRQFMQEGAGRLIVTLPLGALTPGLFVNGGGRNFVWSNREHDPYDRDGGFWVVGGHMELKRGPVTVLTQVGYQQELAQGSEMCERGLMTTVLTRTGSEHLTMTVGASYELRDFYRNLSNRRDHRLSPSATLSVPLVGNMQAVAGAVWLKNASNADYDYTQTLVQVGVVGEL